MLPAELVLKSTDTITRLFGKSFSENLLQFEPGNWTGPVKSSYGLHLVFVHEGIAGRYPALSEIREVVEREWSAKRRKEFKEETYKKLRERYTIVIEGQAPSNDAKN
jgi:parvulin-like peptidyl-prolyl isomerase